MVRDIYQSWLLNCPYDRINLTDYKVAQEWDHELIPDYSNDWELFDFNRPYIRKISLNALDKTMGEYQQWIDFVNDIHERKLDCIILVNDRPLVENPIVMDFNNITLRAYLYHFQAGKVKCQYI